MFELYQLEQLIAFADYGTLSRAAEALHLSQPALSRSMQKLENEFQAPLFERQKNKLELNENGRLAVDCARKLLAQSHSIIEWVRLHDRCSHTIFIGSYVSAILWKIAPLLSDLYPGIAVSGEIKPEKELFQGLFCGTYQLIITSVPVNEPGFLCLKYPDLPIHKNSAYPNSPFVNKKPEESQTVCFLTFPDSMSHKIAALLQLLEERTTA